MLGIPGRRDLAYAVDSALRGAGRPLSIRRRCEEEYALYHAQSPLQRCSAATSAPERLTPEPAMPDVLPLAALTRAVIEASARLHIK